MRTTLRLVLGAAALPLLLTGSLTQTEQKAAADAADYLKAAWVAQAQGLVKLAASDGGVQLAVTDAGGVRAVAVDEHDQRVWTVASGTLRAYALDGQLLLATSLPAGLPADSSQVALAIDSADHTVWLGVQKHLLHFDPQGALLGQYSLAESVRALVVDPVRSLVWIGTHKTLTARDAITGLEAGSIDLGKSPNLQDLAVTDSGALWVALKDTVRRYESGVLAFEGSFTKPQCLAATSNGVWLATKSDLLRLDDAGSVVVQAQPFEQNGTITDLIADPKDDSAWLARPNAVSHVSIAGQLLGLVDITGFGEVRGLALYTDTIPPVLRLTSPVANAYLATNRPVIEVEYSDTGAGVDPSTLAFDIDGSALEVSCTSTQTRAACTPLADLAEGAVTLSATIADYEGNVSEPATVSFTVDTILPVITVFSPPNGLLTNQPVITFSGLVSEPAALTLNGVSVAVGDDLAFSTAVTLAEGPNPIVILAVDGADNRSEIALLVTLDTTPPPAIDATKLTVGTPSGGEVTVTGTAGAAEGSATVRLSNTRSGDTVTTNAGADGAFAVALAAATGDSLALTATDSVGNTGPITTVTVPGGGLPPDPSTVAPPLDRTVATDIFTATEFLYTGDDPIQTGVAPGTIVAKRVAVLRGKVTDRHGQPLSGVTITIKDHAELGQTLTRADGMFDLAVNGGGTLVVQYRKDGFLPAQRQAVTDWQQWEWLPDVVLIPLDNEVTAIDLTQPVMQVARGSVVTDDDGIRQATLLFAAGTTANLVMPDGSTQPISTLHVRATEYTVGDSGPAAMPAELPSNVAYTYCVELSADEAIAAGATSVTFSQAVPFYVDNFLGFPVGINVPVGVYDSNKAVWVPSESGRVLEIVGVTGGSTDLDITGDGIADPPDALAALGITDGERQQLAGLYPAGATLWRVRVQHFSPHDFNWAFGWPPGATAGGGAGTDSPPPDSCSRCGSIIETQGQVLGESLPIAGTPYSLNHRSLRSPGFTASRALSIELSGVSVPASLKRIDLEVDVLGQKLRSSYPSQPEQRITLDPGSLDAYGRAWRGGSSAFVRIGYVYDGGYKRTSRFAAAGSGESIGLGPTRTEATIWREIPVTLGSLDAVDQSVGGWTLSPHHAYDPVSQTLYLGTGERRTAADESLLLDTAVFSSSFGNPQGLAIAADGTLYVSDYGNGRIWRCPVGGPVTQLMSGPTMSSAVEAAPDGTIFVAATLNHSIIKRSPSGLKTVIAGGKGCAYWGDGGPAVDAAMCNPVAVRLGPDGSLYVGHSSSSRVRRITPDGLIFTVAGSNADGYSGDGGPATAAKLNGPVDIEVGSDGSLYIAEYSNHCIRKVGPDGIIHTVAGTGVAGYSGDGGPATSARLYRPSGVALDRDGSLLISDAGNGVLRRVDRDGVISTIAGRSSTLPGTATDHVPARQGNLMVPRHPRIGPDGRIYIPAMSGQRVRVLTPRLPGFSVAEIPIASADGQELYVFDRQGRHLRTVSSLSGAVLLTFEYDANGLLVGITDADGNLTSVGRDSAGTPLAIVAPRGQRTTLSLDSNGHLASVTNPAGETTSFTSTLDGLLASLTDPAGHTSTLTYDALGRLIKDEDAAGGFTELRRTETFSSLEVTASTAEGRSTTYAITKLADGNESRTTRDAGCSCTDASLKATDGSTTSTSRDGTMTTNMEAPDPRWSMQAPLTRSSTVRTPSGLTSTTTAARTVTLSVPTDPFSLATQTDTVTVNGKASTTVLDGESRVATTTSPAGRQQMTVLDERGRVTDEAVGDLAPVSYLYGDSGQLEVVIQGERGSVLMYDEHGNLTSILDPLERTTSFEYDLTGRVTKQVLPDGREIAFTYDADGNVTSINPPGRPAHVFQYTPVNLQQSYTPPDVGIGPVATTYAYNLDKQLTRITRPDGAEVGFAYDTTGRLATITAPHGATTIAYDPTRGQLSTITTPDAQQLAYTYDGFLETGVAWSRTVNGSVSRTYNSDFRVTETKVNGASPVTTTYDNDGLLSATGGLTFTRDAANGLITASSIGTVGDTRTYNPYGELESYTARVGGSDVLATAFKRDLLGRIVEKVETVQGLTTTFGYEYDLAGRLWQVTRTGPDGIPLVTTYAYDLNGNRLSKTDPDGSVTAGTYDDQDRLLSYGDITYTSNANGDLTSKTQNGGTVTYEYDVFGNLRHVTLDNGVELDYVIDGRNRRIGKKIGGTLVQGFLWDDQLRPIAELDASDQVVSRFVYGTHVNVPELIVKGGATYRIVHDHLGSPRLVVNAADGSIAQRLDYDEYGRVILDTNPGFQPFGFAGGLYDPQTKIVRLGGRGYDANVGRWTCKDPILFDGGDKNLYGYVRSDVINNEDPTGLMIWVCNRKSFKLGSSQANHAYFWDDRRGGRACGMQSSCGSSPENNARPEGGPAVDACLPVLGSSGLEDAVMKCCHDTANRGMWCPLYNDCHNAVDKCLKDYGLWGEAWGGRTGPVGGW